MKLNLAWKAIKCFKAIGNRYKVVIVFIIWRTVNKKFHHRTLPEFQEYIKIENTRRYICSYLFTLLMLYKKDTKLYTNVWKERCRHIGMCKNSSTINMKFRLCTNSKLKSITICLGVHECTFKRNFSF